MAAVLQFAERPVPVVQSLSQKQKDILHWVAQGKRNEDIAELMQTSLASVQHHIKFIMGATCTATRAGMVAYALRKGIIE